MDAKQINPFLISFENILNQFGITEIKKGNVFVKQNMTVDKDVTTFIGIVGNIRGNVSYSFSSETAKRLASAMMMGMPVESMDELARSAIAELANMISGNAATLLSDQNTLVDITPPSVIMGEDVYFILGTVTTLTVNMDTGIGAIEINFGLET